MSDDLQKMYKSAFGAVLTPQSSLYGGLAEQMLRDQEKRNEMMRAFTGNSLATLKETMLPSAAFLTESFLPKPIIPNHFTTDIVNTMRSSFMLDMPINGLVESMTFKTGFEASELSRTISSLRYDYNGTLELLKAAYSPPIGMDLFAQSFSASNLGHITGNKFDLPGIIDQKTILKSTFERLQNAAELDLSTIIEQSAAASLASSIGHLPSGEDEDSIIIETESSNIISLHEARARAYEQIVPPEIPLHMHDAFAFLFDLERQMRAFIANVMIISVGSDWESSHLPDGMLEKWIEKHGKAVKAGTWPADTALIQFADFTDYSPIIAWKKNWRFFKDFFGNEDLTRASFQRLFPYRLDTMHAREFSRDDLVIIAADCRFLLKRLRFIKN